MTLRNAIVLGILFAFTVIYWGPVRAMHDGEAAITLGTPDGKQTVQLVREPCPVPDAPAEMSGLARFTTDGVKYDGCWVQTPQGLFLVWPPDKPEPSDDLQEIDAKATKPGGWEFYDPKRLIGA